MDNNLNEKLVTDVTQAIKDLEYDVAKRNEYISKRERYLYSDGLYSDIDFEVGQWFAEHNYLLRVIDIHSAQLMGRGFNIYSYYDKEDLAPYEDNPEELKLAILRNKKAKASADARKKAVDAIIRDNGGFSKFKDGARSGSAFGDTMFKLWYDEDQKKVVISHIESPQNFRAGWTDSDFRERDWDAYVWQISKDKATRSYGSKLAAGEEFKYSKNGSPFEFIPQNDSRQPETDRKFVTCVEFTGFLPGWKGKDGKLVKAKLGEETKVNLLIVGGKLVQIITDEHRLPNYYIIHNRQEPRAAWGKSDLPQSALDINQEVVQLEADSLTWANKNLFKLIQAKGFTPEAIPKKKARKTQVVAMAPEQELVEMGVSGGTLQEYRQLIEDKLNAFVRVTGVGRVLFDDPSVNTGSNQALITTLKPVIDIVEDKQSRWDPVLVQMFTDALKLAARDIPELKEAVLEDDNWFLCVEWPSVLRREDSAYQSMWINRLAAGSISLETYMEKMGDDYSEEIDRIRDEMKDPVVAAVFSRQLGLLAQNVISPPSNTPPAPDVKYNVQVKADASVDPSVNLAVIDDVMQDKSGPIAPAAPVPSQNQPGQLINPDQNSETTQPVSQPGSGQATPVSPEGAVAQQNQNIGA